jgi:hypothetical protein
MASAFRYYLIGVALVTGAHANATQEVRDTSSGFAYANRVSSECHAVSAYRSTKGRWPSRWSRTHLA